MRVTPLEWWAYAALAAAAALAACYWYTGRGYGGSGRHVLGRPRFDGDPGSWDRGGPKATLAPAPPIDWATAPRPEPAEIHADMFGVPAPKYTELDAWRAEEEAAERLAETSERAVVAAIIRGLEYRDTIDLEAGLIVERLCAELTMIDIGADLS